MSISKPKKFLSLMLALLMVITAIPAAIFTVAGEYPVMEAFTAASSSEFHAYYNSICTATFLDSIDWEDINSEDTVAFWDTSAENDESVMAWIKLNADKTAQAGANRYDLYIAGEGGVGANANSGYIFYSFSALEEVKGCENFNTSNATTMKGMFYNCPALKNISGINWDTSNVTDMSYMFRNCHEIKELDLRTFDTSKVTTMQYMFYLCKKLNCIYVGEGWTTESLVKLNDGIFNCCYALISGIDINTAEDEKKQQIYTTPILPISL